MTEGAKVGRLRLEEWRDLPATFDAKTTSDVMGRALRFVYKHADELGGRKIGGRIYFSKSRIAEILGLETA